MIHFLGAIALVLAAPVAAQAGGADPHAGHSQQQHEQHQQGHDGHGDHKMDCCKDGKMDCCEKMKQQGKAMDCCSKKSGAPAKAGHEGHGTGH